MRVTRHKRQILLFLVAIIAPAGVLIGLGGRLLYQDRELSVKRSADQRHAAIDQLRRELITRLAALRLEEINRQIRSGPAGNSDNPAVLFAATLKGDTVVMPWEAGAHEYRGEFAERFQEGETLELGKKDYSAAATAYRAAISLGRNTVETMDARLHLARTLASAGNSVEANRLYLALLKDTTGTRDADGVGFRFYAADQLLNSGASTTEVKELVGREATSQKRLSLRELYMIRRLGPDADISARIEEQEQWLALSKDIVRIRTYIEAGAGWIPYGPEPWLVTVTPAQAASPRLVLAVSSNKIAPPGVTLHGPRHDSAEGEAVGDEIPGLRLAWSGNQLQERSGLPTGIWIAGLVLVLGMAVFGGYLLLRDVNRDLHVTEMRSQFVASVSHELKTPLTAIRMYAETLAMGRSRDENTRSEYLETIVNESERLARLVDNVLDFSKIEQGKKIYRLRPARIEDVAGAAVRPMQFPLAQAGFRLNFRAPDEMPMIEADPDAIQQAILNLLTNAMKYSGDAREIDLTIAAQKGAAVIQVKDRGLGLTPEEQKHIFDKFYRAPSHENRLIAGTGLGLTLVDHITKAHHGRVEVESAPGAGSTFSIIIPFPKEQPSIGVVRDRKEVRA